VDRSTAKARSNRLACVSLAAFPLQLLLKRHPEWSAYPAAVVAEDKPQAIILWVNEKAQQAGVRPDLRFAAASSLAPHLRAGVVPLHEIKKETAALTERLRRFTPDVEASQEEPGVFWLSGRGLHLLYSSPKKWAAAISAGIEALGFRAGIAVGFTRFGTYAVAKRAKGTVVFRNLSEERAAGRAVSLDCLNLDRDFRAALAKLGIKNVGALLSLPPGGLYERFGSQAYHLYQAALGDLGEPLRPCQAQEPIKQKLLLDEAETDSSRLLFLVKCLLHPLLTKLASRGEALAALLLRLLSDRSCWREERIQPAAPTLDSVQVMDLVRLRLETLEFFAGVIEIELIAEGSPAAREQLRFFVERPGRDLEAANRALARLRAEFGKETVARAKLADKHLPEARFSWEPLERVEPPRNDLNRPAAKVVVRRILAKPIPLSSQPKTHEDGWLLLGPKYGSVEKLSGPYVISGGWWNREIHREYYFAETRRGDMLWIYYDKVRRRWFLQGWVE